MSRSGLLSRTRRSRHSSRRKSALLGGMAAGMALIVAARGLARRRANKRFDLLGKVVVITGGSRGLGYALAEECACRAANVVICARDERELRWAKEAIEQKYGIEVMTQVCDVTVNDEVTEFITAVLARYGKIDVLINNAGTISVGPIEAQTLTDFQEAMDVMYWGILYPTLAIIPHMQGRGEGRIANITSFGGKVSVPHLVPYSAAKFAAVGLSEGLRAELLKDGIKVTTVCPGLMRTGSHLNAYFKGDNQKEFTWFAMGAALPVVSIHARRAARKIIDAVRHGDAELIITPQAKAAALFHGVFPGLTANILGVVNRFMPSATGGQRERHLGKQSETAITRSFVTKAGRKAAKEFHQHPGAYEEGPGPGERQLA